MFSAPRLYFGYHSMINHCDMCKMTKIEFWNIFFIFNDFAQKFSSFKHKNTTFLVLLISSGEFSLFLSLRV